MSKDFEIFLGDGSKGIQDGLKTAQSLLAGVKAGYPTAVMRALNRAAITGRSGAVKSIRKIYTVKSSAMKSAFTIEKASTKSLEAAVSIKGKKIALQHFKFSPKSDTTGNARKPVRVSVLRGGGMKPIRNAFVFKGRILQRTETTSTPLRDVEGPSAPSMVSNPDIVISTEKVMQETFLKRLEHETIELLRSGAKGKNGGKMHE